jgi:Winged helix domain
MIEIQEKAVFTVTNPEQNPFRLFLKGRNAWAMRQLKRAGPDGCTPICNPAPRWAAYVHNLRCLGVLIETVMEMHGKPYPGHHARYVLQSRVTGGAA